MDLPPYPQYKETGHYWLKDIPTYWDIASLRLISKRYSGGTPDKKRSDFWQDGTVPWLNSGEVNQGLIKKPTTHITEEALKLSSAKWIPAGSIIIALAGQGKTKGTAAYTCFEATCNQSMAAVVFDKDNPKYMYWWLKSQYKNIRGMASDDGRDGLNLEMIGSIPCPIPPINEQSQIAKFLDYKTAHIDKLIKKKKALIEILNEQRITMITHAVTKGLIPNASMMDSAMDWLGKVPAHWEITKFKYQVGFQEGPGIMAVDFRDSGVPLVRIRNVQEEYIDLDGCNFLDPDKVEARWPHFRCQLGDLIISGSASTGLISEVAEDSVGAIVYTGLIRLWAIGEIQKEFIRWFVSSNTFFSQIDMFKTGSTIQHF